MRKLIFAAFALILIGAGCGKQAPLPLDTASPILPAQPQTIGKKRDLSRPGIFCALLTKEDVHAVTGIAIMGAESTPTECAFNAQHQTAGILPVITFRADQTIKWEPDDFDYDKESAAELGIPMIEVSKLGERALYWDIQGSKNNINPNLRWIKDGVRLTIIAPWLQDYGFDTEQKRKEVLVELAKIVDKNW